MSLMEQRERTFENIFTQRETTHFLTLTQALSEFSLWASERLGHDESTRKAYSDELQHLFLLSGDLKKILVRVAEDFAAKGLAETPVVIEAHIGHMVAEASAKHYASS